MRSLFDSFPDPEKGASVRNRDETNAESILANGADTASGNGPFGESASPARAIYPLSGSAPVITDALTLHFPDHRNPSCCRKARERRREVMADLDSFEPPAERLRRCEWRHRTAESALFPLAGGVRLRSGSPVPQ